MCVDVIGRCVRRGACLLDWWGSGDSGLDSLRLPTPLLPRSRTWWSSVAGLVATSTPSRLPSWAWRSPALRSAALCTCCG